MNKIIKKALVIGDLYSVHTLRVTRSLSSQGWSVFGLPVRSEKAYSGISVQERLNAYQKVLAPIFPDSYYQKAKIGKLVYLLKKHFSIRLDINNMSVVNFQSVNPVLSFLFRDLQIRFPVISSFWGSEIWEDLPRLRRYYQSSLLRRSQIVTVVSEKMKERVIKVFPNISESKIRLVRFGMMDTNIIDEIDEYTVNSFKRRLGIPENSLICTISYSSAHRHRQDKVLHVIETLEPDIIREKDVRFVLPLTYGDHNYREYLKGCVKKYKYADRITIIENTLQDKEVASLRKITDIFISVPTQDTFSATMCEHLYAGSVVITGRWLPYDDIFNSNIFLLTVQDIENSLGETLLNVINNINKYKENTKQNREIVPKLVSNDMWPKIFEEAIELWKKE